MNRQVGFTPPGLNPPYVNVQEISDDMVRVTVRSPNSADPKLLVSQPVAYIDMAKKDWHQFTVDIDNEIFPHMFGRRE